MLILYFESKKKKKRLIKVVVFTDTHTHTHILTLTPTESFKTVKKKKTIGILLFILPAARN